MGEVLPGFECRADHMDEFDEEEVSVAHLVPTFMATAKVA